MKDSSLNGSLSKILGWVANPVEAFDLLLVQGCLLPSLAEDVCDRLRQQPSLSGEGRRGCGRQETGGSGRGKEVSYFCFCAMRASSSSPSGALCFTRKLSTHSRAKSRWRRQLTAAVTPIAMSAPRLARVMSLCASHSSPCVPR